MNRRSFVKKTAAMIGVLAFWRHNTDVPTPTFKGFMHCNTPEFLHVQVCASRNSGAAQIHAGNLLRFTTSQDGSGRMTFQVKPHMVPIVEALGFSAADESLGDVIVIHDAPLFRQRVIG